MFAFTFYIILAYLLFASEILSFWINEHGTDEWNLKKLEFHSGYYTRYPENGIRQLNCVGSNSDIISQNVKIIECHNMGFNESKIVWKCCGSLKFFLEFKSANISCMGTIQEIDKGNRTYLIEGSCGLYYSMDVQREYSNALLTLAESLMRIVIFSEKEEKCIFADLNYRNIK